MVPFFYAILIWIVFPLEWREGRSEGKLGWFFFPSTNYGFDGMTFATVLTEWYSFWREAKDIPVEEKSKCDWHKLLLEQVFPSFSIGYFLRQVTRTDQNARWNLLYLWFICWRERGFCVDLGSENIDWPWSETRESGILSGTVVFEDYGDGFWFC